MTPPVDRRGSGRTAQRRGSSRKDAQGNQKRNRQPQKAVRDDSPTRATPPQLEPMELGFVRGVAPSKWAERWARAVRNQELILTPVALDEVDAARVRSDVLLERVAPEAHPLGTAPSEPVLRHGLRLYEEGVALVVEAGHELSRRGEVDLEDLSLLPLIAHPDHHDGWPAAQPWADASWMPADAEATLELVATGVGGALMALPLARHLAGKRTHSVVPVAARGTSLLTGTEIWASWRIERDAPDVQRLIGVLRGRTARSSR